MCLLIALSGVLPGAPLLVAANRDELYDRPAEMITVLRAGGPRILGGRDALAGGTWLAVNEHGLVAGLTNQPSAGARDDTRRSRGELPLAFAAHPDAATAVAKVCGELDPADYNPCWLLVGDRRSLFSVGMAGGRHPVVRQLPPGTYVLENLPLPDSSPKTRQVASMVAAGIARTSGHNGAAGASGTASAQAKEALAAEETLAEVLRDHRPAAGPHELPAGDQALAAGEQSLAAAAAAERSARAAGPVRPAELSAACVHTPGYGTRSSMIVSVGITGPPRVLVADGPSCQAPFRNVTSLWTAAWRDSTR